MGCGNPVDEAKNTPVSDDQATELSEKILGGAGNPLGSSYQGHLPKASPPPDVADVQARFLAVLAEGVPAEKFADMEMLPPETISGSMRRLKPMPLESSSFRMNLVRSHLKKVTSDACEGDEVFEGWIAALPYTFASRTEPAIMQTFVRPYKVRICATDSTLNYDIVDLDNVLNEGFGTSAKREKQELTPILQLGVRLEGVLPEIAEDHLLELHNIVTSHLQDGLAPAVFAGAKNPVSSSIKFASGEKYLKPRGPEEIDGKYRMYLVGRTLQPLNNGSLLTCNKSAVSYKGLVAARPYMTRTPARTNATTETVNAYEMHFCIVGADVSVALAPGER